MDGGISMRNMEAVTVANVVVKEFISRLGVPKHLHADQPLPDGMMERFIWTLLNMLSTAVDNNHRNWDLPLSMLMLAYRTSVHETTGATYLSLMFGRSPLSTYNSPSQYQKQFCTSTFSKLITQFVNIHPWNTVGTSISTTSMYMAPHITLGMKYGYTVQLYQEDTAES